MHNAHEAVLARTLHGQIAQLLSELCVAEHAVKALLDHDIR